MAHNGTMVMMMMIVMAIIVTIINMMLWFTMAREMTIKIKMINARVKKARGALARLSGNFHISTPLYPTQRLCLFSMAAVFHLLIRHMTYDLLDALKTIFNFTIAL